MYLSFPRHGRMNGETVGGAVGGTVGQLIGRSVGRLLDTCPVEWGTSPPALDHKRNQVSSLNTVVLLGQAYMPALSGHGHVTRVA